jgi:hypothetical protein
MFTRSRSKSVLAAAVAALAVGGAGAFAAIPNSTTGVINSCVDNSTGTTRIIDSQAGATCSATEKSVLWNQIGRTGPTGPRGPKGDPGPARAYWAKFSGDGRLVAASEKPEYAYAYGNYGYNYVAFTNVDPRRCSVSVTAGTVGQTWKGISTQYWIYEAGSTNYVLAYAFDNARNTFVAGVPMDVLINCSDTTYTP